MSIAPINRYFFVTCLRVNVTSLIVNVKYLYPDRMTGTFLFVGLQFSVFRTDEEKLGLQNFSQLFQYQQLKRMTLKIGLLFSFHVPITFLVQDSVIVIFICHFRCSSVTFGLCYFKKLFLISISDVSKIVC